MSSVSPNGNCDACWVNKPCERTLQTCKRRPALHRGEHTCLDRCWKCGTFHSRSRRVKRKKANPPTFATAKKSCSVAEEKNHAPPVAKNQNPAPCGANKQSAVKAAAQQQPPTAAARDLCMQQKITTMTKESAASTSSTLFIISLVSSDEEENGDFDFKDFEPPELVSLKKISNTVATPEAECFAHTADIIQSRNERPKPTPTVPKNQNPAPCRVKNVPAAEPNVQQQHPTPETRAQQQPPPTDAGTHQQPLTSTMTKKSADSASSAHPIVSLISSDEEGSGDFDFQDFEPPELASLKKVSNTVATPEAECFVNTADIVQSRIERPKPTPSSVPKSQNPAPCRVKNVPAAEHNVQQQHPTPGTRAKQLPPMPETRAHQQPPTPETGAQQQPPTPETRAHQQPPTPETPAQQQPPMPEIRAKQQRPTPKTRAQQQPPTPETRAQQQPPTTETRAQQQPPTPETHEQQQPPTTETRSQQQPRHPTPMQTNVPRNPSNHQK